MAKAKTRENPLSEVFSVLYNDGRSSESNFKPIWLQGKHKTKYKTRAHKAFHRGAVKQVEEIQIITIIVVSIL